MSHVEIKLAYMVRTGDVFTIHLRNGDLVRISLTDIGAIWQFKIKFIGKNV